MGRANEAEEGYGAPADERNNQAEEGYGAPLDERSNQAEQSYGAPEEYSQDEKGEESRNIETEYELPGDNFAASENSVESNSADDSYGAPVDAKSAESDYGAPGSDYGAPIAARGTDDTYGAPGLSDYTEDPTILCPGGDLTACVKVCPGITARIYGACMVGCADRCS